MEQIDLALIIGAPATRWCDEDAKAQAEMLAQFPYSVPVATSFLEMDSVEAWLGERYGPLGNQWDRLFYYKQAYDFGYAEYFFRNPSVLAAFMREIPNVYGVFADSQKLRTDRNGEYFEIESRGQF